MSGSALDAALTALTAVYTTAVAGVPEMAVFDGEAVDPPRQFLCVGWDETDEAAVSATRASNNAALTTQFDSYVVSNLLTCWAGNLTGPQCRSATFTLFDLLDAATVANHDLGGVVAQARISGYEYTPDVRPQGALALIRFTVTILCFT